MEPLHTEIVDAPADDKIIRLQDFIDFNLLFGVVRCLNDQIVRSIDNFDCQKNL